MQRSNKSPFLALIMFFMFLFLVYGVFMSPSVVSAATVPFFSLDWNYPALAPGAISQHALDAMGQMVYFGSSVTTGSTNFLYAVNITSGKEIWKYNTSLPVDYVSNFTYNNSPYIIAGTGYPLGNPSIPALSHVFAFPLQSNQTFWKSAVPKVSIASLSSAESNITGNENVVAGLENGTVVCLSGLDGHILWQQNCTGSVFSIVDLRDGSVAVGSLNYSTGTGQVYRFNEKNGTWLWSYPQKPINGLSLTLIRKFVDVSGTPETIAVFDDGLIHVLSGKTGQDLAPWPFNNTRDNVKDLLCTQDYTSDGFPDILVGTDGGNLSIIDGRTATRVGVPVNVGYTVTYIQYMSFYENGFWYSNKTLAVSLLDSSFARYVYGINASDLATMKQFPVPSGVTAQNLLSVGNYTSAYTGDLLFTASNVVYLLSGADIISSEFPSQIILAIFIVAVWFLVAILRRERLRID